MKCHEICLMVPSGDGDGSWITMGALTCSFFPNIGDVLILHNDEHQKTFEKSDDKKQRYLHLVGDNESLHDSKKLDGDVLEDYDARAHNLWKVVERQLDAFNQGDNGPHFERNFSEESVSLYLELISRSRG